MKVAAIDFDGTVVEHAYPFIGKTLPNAFETLKAMQENDWYLILWTCREGNELREAVEFCTKNGVHFDGVNSTPDYLPHSSDGIKSRKVVADVYVDDKAFGGFPGWDVVRKELVDD